VSSTNQSPFYQQAEAKYLAAQTNEDKVYWLEQMIKECPKHKSAEKMLANLKTRLIKLKESIERKQRIAKGSRKSGIKKGELQAVIVSKTKSGKSTLMQALTNARPEISDYEFTTKIPVLGTLIHEGVNIQIIENPAIESEYYNRGLTNSADTLLILVTKIEEIPELQEKTQFSKAKKFFVFNKSDLLSENEKRKLQATIASKKYNCIIISAKTKENLNTLKEKIFQSFNKIRIYTKKPEKHQHEPLPVIMPPESTVEQVAEKILHGFSKNIKEIRIWGPSSKFAGQKVGLTHKLKDKDIVEFKMR
jgi:hypothetical protein